MPDFKNINWQTILTRDTAMVAVRVVLIILVGKVLFSIIGALVGRFMKKRTSEQATMLGRKFVGYTGWIVVMLLVATELKFDLTALLGAAGIAGIAIGFASQTSVSNVISGIFLVSEKPFAVGDVIGVGSTKGVVYSIGLLAVQLRTFNNQFVRIPNETIIKTEVVNITRFPIRRLDLDLGVAYKEDIGRVETILRDVAKRNPQVLDEPEPLFIFTTFGDSALQILFGVWFAKADFIAVRNSIMREIKERFDAEDIEIPFPHRTIYTGAVTDPFPFKVVGGAEVLPASGAQGDSASPASGTLN